MKYILKEDIFSYYSQFKRFGSNNREVLEFFERTEYYNDGIFPDRWNVFDERINSWYGFFRIEIVYDKYVDYLIIN